MNANQPRVAPAAFLFALALVSAAAVAGCAGSVGEGAPARPAPDSATADGGDISADAANAEASADAGREPNPLAPGVIVVLGSSTAAGFGPSNANDAWVRRYQNDLAVRFPNMGVINLAVGGYNTYHIQPTGFAPPDGRAAPNAEKNITAALALGADAIVINMPSNDQAAGHTLLEVMDNFERVTDEASAAGVPCWVTTTQPRNLNAGGKLALITARDAILAAYGEYAIDFWTDLAEPDGGILPAYDSGDSIHMNGAAHAILTDRVLAAQIAETVAR
jgi:lysophospholipase L1-like esterase